MIEGAAIKLDERDFSKKSENVSSFCGTAGKPLIGPVKVNPELLEVNPELVLAESTSNKLLLVLGNPKVFDLQ